MSDIKEVSQEAFNECYKQNKEYIFTMNDYDEFELNFKKFMDYLPDMMEQNDILPTVSNIKDCLISFIEEITSLPDIVKDQYITEINNNKNFCYIINDRDELNVMKFSNDIVPINIKDIEDINKKQEQGILTETDILNYKLGIADIHH